MMFEGTRSSGRPRMRWLENMNADLKEMFAQAVDAQDGMKGSLRLQYMWGELKEVSAYPAAMLDKS